MKKLVKGLLEFKRHIRPGYAQTFSRLAQGQKPDALMITCADSRVVPNLFASTDPGDIFTHRNVGNVVPSCNADKSQQEESEGASIEYAVEELKVTDIIVCGHSRCGAMNALLNQHVLEKFPHTKSWLRHAHGALKQFEQKKQLDSKLELVDQLSQLNVHQQVANIASYPSVQKAIKDRGLRLHAWWFDIAAAEVHVYREMEKTFQAIDEKIAESILAVLDHGNR